MCVDVLVKSKRGETLCSTVGELAEALGVRQKHVSDDPFNCCLCNARLLDLGAKPADMSEDLPFGSYVIEVQA